MQKDLENITSKEVSGEGVALEVLLCKLESSVLYAVKKGQNKNFTWLPCVLLPTQIRTELEMQMVCNLREFKEFIDNEMIVILGQMDSPTQIFDHVFLVSLTVNLRVNTPNTSHSMSWLTRGSLEELKGTLKEKLADPGVTYS